MFRIIRDEEEARLFLGAGLLWWVSEEDGADTGARMPTRPVKATATKSLVRSWLRHGVLGIRLEE